jgi:hypothetical protein
MVYKSLNTFIDDLFAFVIKMPLMHRLSCFRDDIIFFIYLYQKWAYRVDHSRVNEFGQGGDDDEVADKVAEVVSVEGVGEEKLKTNNTRSGGSSSSNEKNDLSYSDSSGIDE